MALLFLWVKCYCLNMTKLTDKISKALAPPIGKKGTSSAKTTPSKTEDIAQSVVSLLFMRKSRDRWRFVALLAVAALLLITFSVGQPPQGDAKHKGDSIARIAIEGVIWDNPYQQEVLADIAADKSIKGLIVEVNSPGGTMVGGINLYHALRHVAHEKPVVIVQKTVAASAGYLISLAGDYILTNEATLTGSIGVMMPLIDTRELAAKIGIKSDTIVSGELKAVNSPLWPRDGEDRAYLQSMVDKLSDIFYLYLQQRRPDVSAKAVAMVRDGRALIGAEAVQMKLADDIGGVGEAKQWLIKTAELPDDIHVQSIPMEKQTWWEEAFETKLTTTLSGLLKPAVWGIVY